MPSLRNLQTLLLAVVLLALLPMLGLGLHTSLSYRAQALATAQANALRLVRLLEGEQRQAVLTAGMLLQTLGEVPQVVQGDRVGAGQLFASLLRHFPQFANILALTPEGRVYASAVEGFNGKDLAQDEAVEAARRSRALALGSFHVCPVTGKMVLTFAQPVLDSAGNLRLLLTLDFDLAYAGSIIHAAGLPLGSTFVMSDHTGSILYRYPDPDLWQGKPVQGPLHETMLALGTEEGVFQALGLDQVPRLYAFKLFSLGPQGQGIHLRIGIPKAAVLGSVDTMLLLHTAGAAVIAILVLWLARIGCSRMLFRPISRLIAAAQAIAQGRLQERSDLPHTEDDLGLLARAFDTMAASLQRREQEQNKAAQRIFESGERIRGMLNASSDSVILVDTEGRILDLNPIAAKRRTRLPEELLGTSLFDALPQASAQLRKAKMAEAVQSGDTVIYEERRGPYWYGIRLHPIRDAQGTVVQLVGYSRDITERKRAEERLTRQAFEDELTALPNRALFIQELEKAIRASQCSAAARYAVLFLDIDNFKLVNDSFGHQAGDKLLRNLGRRLREAVGSGRLVARFGGDEFAVLAPELLDAIDALRLADAIHRALQHPEQVQGLEIHTSASIGVVYGKLEYTQAEQVLRDADIAMYQAKAKGRGNTECFTLEMRNQVNERMRLEHELRSALDNGELLLHYQPYYTLPEQRLAGFEALVRWQHPKRGLIPPTLFIPIAEETGLIHPLGSFVLHEALRTLRLWNEALQPEIPLRMNVNLSPHQIFHGDPVALVREALARHGVAAELLVLEVTETSLAEDMEHAADILGTLRHFGVRTALDDFGTGYSSLAYLRSLPLDVLKLDRSFLQHLGRDTRDTAIAAKLVALAHALGLSVTAEGVENAGVQHQLERMHCDTVQGFFLSRPLPAAEIPARILKINLRP